MKKVKLGKNLLLLTESWNFQKKPSLILHLKSIIQSQKTQCLLLRDLEKEVECPSIFRVTGGNRTPPMVMLTEKAAKVALEEDEARVQMEPILVKNLRKLLMLSVGCMLPLETIQLIENDLGLPSDFRQSLIPKYSQVFSVKDVNGRTSLQLENWGSFLSVTAREERLACEEVLTSKGQARLLKDGNYVGPFAFQIRYPAGFRPNMNYLKEVQKCENMEFPSSYLNAKRFELADPKARKRVITVLHELLSLTMERRLTSGQIDAFHFELGLGLVPRLLFCLIKQHGIFCLTNKCVRSTVILKEAYDGSNLFCKCPLLLFRDKFMALIGRRDIGSLYRVTETIGVEERLMDRNRCPQGEAAQILVEFLEVAITSVVFLKGVYPSGAFERRRYMNVVVQRAGHPELQQYIHSSVNGLLPFIQKGLVERVAVIFSDSNNVPLERFVFKINVNQSHGSKLEEADLEFSLRSFLIKLPLSQSLMKVLPPDCRWEITAYFRSLVPAKMPKYGSQQIPGSGNKHLL
ncbi:unnamed protein product [Withania somnifera]